MGLIQDIENALLDKLKSLFAPVLAPLTRLWQILKGFFTALVDVVPETIALVKLIYSEVLEWKRFKLSVNIKGVINLQSAQDRIQELIDELLQGWHSLVDLFTSGFKISVRPITEAEQAAQELAEVLEGFTKLGLKDFVIKFGESLKKAGGKVFEILAVLQAVAEELLRVVRELHDIVQAVKDIRETFEHGEGLFLPQTNKRKSLALADGGEIKIRVGNLHS